MVYFFCAIHLVSKSNLLNFNAILIHSIDISLFGLEELWSSIDSIIALQYIKSGSVFSSKSLLSLTA